MYNDKTEEIEYIEEVISVETPNTIEPKPTVVDLLSEYWGEDSIELLKDSCFIAEA